MRTHFADAQAGKSLSGKPFRFTESRTFQMSEYQYYEFQAVDHRLDEKQMREFSLIFCASMRTYSPSLLKPVQAKNPNHRIARR
jgi:hypothetical protein